MLLMMIFPFASDPLVMSITILNSVGISIVVLFVLMWRRATPAGPEATVNGRASQLTPSLTV